MDMHRQDVQSTKGESYPWIIHHTTHPRKLFLQIVLQKIRNSFCFLRLSIVFTIQILKPYLQLPAVSSLWCPARLPFPTHRAVALFAAITFTSTTIATRPFGTFLSAIPLQKSPFPALSFYVLLVVTLICRLSLSNPNIIVLLTPSKLTLATFSQQAPSQTKKSADSPDLVRIP